MRQANMLREEGVVVNTGVGEEENDHNYGNHAAINPDAFGFAGVEGGRVSLRQYGWFPEPDL